MNTSVEKADISADQLGISVGETVKPIQLMSIDGKAFRSEDLAGRRYMISFFRFASCPFCNLRMHSLVKRYAELGDDFTIVAIFDSPLDNLREQTEGHHAPFPVLADETNTYYRQYGIKYSVLGIFVGMLKRFPSLLKATLMHGYWPLKIKGKMHTMPADFLVDEQGTIQTAYYGKDEGDHLSFDIIKQFSHG